MQVVEINWMPVAAVWLLSLSFSAKTRTMPVALGYKLAGYQVDFDFNLWIFCHFHPRLVLVFLGYVPCVR